MDRKDKAEEPQAMSVQTVVSATPEEAAAACGVKMLEVLAARLEVAESCHVAISGGSTPKLLFAWFANCEFDWSRVHLYWVDERAVPPGDPQSNFTLADKNWLTPAAYPKGNIHRVRAELPVEEAANQYAHEIMRTMGLSDGEIPVFDIVQQGMGADVHTASLFPGEPLLQDSTGVAAAVYVEKLKSARVTLLPEVLRRARHTMMLVCGADKREALQTVFHGAENLAAYPAQMTRQHRGEVTWFLDEAAAEGLR